MLRRMLPLVALLAAGCVPVTEPLSDITKAEPDKAVLGKWEGASNGAADLTIEVPDVKGNPKGLMLGRPTESKDPADGLWFYTCTVGKHTYANVILDGNAKDGLQKLRFDREGEFADWQKAARKRYFIFRYKLDGEKLIIDGGSKSAFEELMKAEKFKDADGFYKAPAGWLAKHLDKKGSSDALFDGKNVEEYKRAKK